MAGNSAVIFPDATQAGTSCTFDCFRDNGDRGDSGFIWGKARATGMTVEMGSERKLMTGVPGGKKYHIACRIAVNGNADAPTHSERSPSMRDRRYE